MRGPLCGAVVPVLLVSVCVIPIAPAAAAPSPAWGSRLLRAGGRVLGVVRYRPPLDPALARTPAARDSVRRARAWRDSLFAARAPGAFAVPDARLERAQLEPGVVVLEWWLADSLDRGASVRRRSSPGGWVVLGVAVADRAGRLAWRDSSATPGAAMTYELEVACRSRRICTARATLAIPGGRHLRMCAASGGTALAATFYEGRPARLEVFDLAGRRRHTRDVIPRTAGVVELPLADAGLPAGVYWARLSQGEQFAGCRVTVL